MGVSHYEGGLCNVWLLFSEFVWFHQETTSCSLVKYRLAANLGVGSRHIVLWLTVSFLLELQELVFGPDAGDRGVCSWSTISWHLESAMMTVVLTLNGVDGW